jgi:peptide/nickel transport system substrate-binding protein
MKKMYSVILLLAGLLLLSACQPEAVEVEVTRVVTETITEEMEVTRVVEGEVVTEMVEVTRVVEVEAPAPEVEMVRSDIVIGSFVPPQTFDAGKMNWGNQSIFGQAVYDPLVRVQSNGVDVASGLATSWEYNADNTVLTMQLRDDVVFTDGTPFNAEAAAANLIRFRDGTSPQRQKAAGIVEATAVDDYTLQITLDKADPAFLVFLGLAPGQMMSPAAFENEDIDTNPVGSGPYILDTEATVVGSSYVFRRNPGYWDPSIQYYETLTVNVYSDATAILNALRGGQLNVARLNDNSTVPQIVAAGYDVHVLNLDMQGLFLWDRGGELNPAIGDVRVRQAINYAIDSEALLDVIALGYGELSQQPFPESSTAHIPELDSTYSYDPDKARELLAEAGYADGFELVIPQTARTPRDIPPLVGQMLADVGITVEWVDAGTSFIADMLGAKYAVSWFQLQQDPVDSQLVNFLLAENATWNPFHYHTPESDALIERVFAGGPDADAAAQELNRYVVENAWFNEWYNAATITVSDATTDVTVNQGNAHPYIWDIKPAP